MKSFQTLRYLYTSRFKDLSFKNGEKNLSILKNKLFADTIYEYLVDDRVDLETPLSICHINPLYEITKTSTKKFNLQ